jgi:putative ABC transport system substrate-binding protein
MPDAAEKGALVSLEINPVEQGQLAAEQIARILSVKKFPQIPVAVPKKNDLVINLRAAKHLDLTVPFQALSNATRIIK